MPMDFADDLPEENSAWFCQKRFINKLAAEDIVHELKHCSTGAAGSLVLGSRRVEPHCKSTETVARHSYDSFAFLDVLDFVSALHFRLIQAIQTPIRGPSLVARVNGAGHSSWWLPYFAQFCLELAPASMCIYMYLSLYILVCFSNVICFVCSYILLNVDYVFTCICYGLLSQTYIGYIICKNINESGSISAYIVFYANEYISARYTYVNRTIVYIYIFIQTQDSICRTHKTVHEVNGRNVRSDAHVFDHFCSSFPSSFLQGAIFFVSSQICHTSSDFRHRLDCFLQVTILLDCCQISVVPLLRHSEARSAGPTPGPLPWKLYDS